MVATKKKEQLVVDGAILWDSPWGPIQHFSTIAEGIYGVSTAGHGGLKLSQDRQSKMPDVFKLTDGWYEEDCACAFVMLAFPDVFYPDTVMSAHTTAKNTFPDEYEAHFGGVIPIEESYTKRERKFATDHANDWVSCAAWGNGQKSLVSGKQYFVPADMVLVVCRKGVGGPLNAEERFFLVSEKEYATRSFWGFVIDETKHQRVDENRPVAMSFDLGMGFSQPDPESVKRINRNM